MIKKTLLAPQDELIVNITVHKVPASLLGEFAEKIVRPYYKGNLNAAIQDLINKALSEQEFIQAHVKAKTKSN
jgi:hypothetical protein